MPPYPPQNAYSYPGSMPVSRPDDEQERPSTPAVQPSGGNRYTRMINDAEQRVTSRAAPSYGGSTPTAPGGFDPSNPNKQYSYDGKADLGANNGFNQANNWKMYYENMQRMAGDATRSGERAQGSRENADSWRGQYQTPGYEAPADFSYNPWGQQRPGMANDEDFATAHNRYSALMNQTGGPVQSRDADAYDTGGFGGAFYNYANAGANILQTKMKDTHRGLTDNAAGRGRLNTGFFDEDTGNLWRQLSGEATDQMNSRALDAARLDMEPAMQNARLRTQVSEGNADRDLQGQRYGQDDRQFLMDFTSGREDARGSRADRAYEFDRNAYGDDRNFDFDVYRDGRDFGRGTYQDDRNFGRDVFEGDRGFDEDRYRFDEGMYRGDRDTYMDAVTGARDWRTQQQQQSAQESANSGFRGFLNNYALPIAGMATNFMPTGGGAPSPSGGGSAGTPGVGHGGSQGGGRPARRMRY